MDDNRRVAVLHWYEDVDDLAQTLNRTLTELGYQPFVIQMPPQARPFWIHWSTEDCPDIRLPGWVTLPIGRALAWLERWQDADGLWRSLAQTAPLQAFNRRFHKFRYVGIYDYALKTGLMGLLVEYSRVYADYYKRVGIPARYVRWGLLDNSHEEGLNLERDIDVLWIGTRRTKRRSKLLNKVMGELEAHGKRVLVIDGSNGAIYGPQRTRLLHRAKILLNLLPTWYDSALAYRWPLAAANRALLVTEDSLPHAPEFLPGVHYVAVPVHQLVPTILDYLEHPEKRAPIVERAYQAVMHEHTLLDSVCQIMHWAEHALQALRRNEYRIDRPSSLAYFTIPFL